MSLIFLVYALAFLFLWLRYRRLGMAFLGLAVLLSAGMFFYHVDPALNLNLNF